MDSSNRLREELQRNPRVHDVLSIELVLPTLDFAIQDDREPF